MNHPFNSRHILWSSGVGKLLRNSRRTRWCIKAFLHPRNCLHDAFSECKEDFQRIHDFSSRRSSSSSSFPMHNTILLWKKNSSVTQLPRCRTDVPEKELAVLSFLPPPLRSWSFLIEPYAAYCAIRSDNKVRIAAGASRVE